MKKILTFLVLLTLLNGNYVFAQTNFEFFFKSDTEYQDVVIKEVISADTFRLDGTGEIIKLIGLNAPDISKYKRDTIRTQERDSYGFIIEPEVSPTSSMEERSYIFAKTYLLGKHVRLEFDDQKKADNGYTVAYAFFKDDNTFINAEILRQGFAQLRSETINKKYETQLREAYSEAKKELRGIYGQ